MGSKYYHNFTMLSVYPPYSPDLWSKTSCYFLSSKNISNDIYNLLFPFQIKNVEGNISFLVCELSFELCSSSSGSRAVQAPLFVQMSHWMSREMSRGVPSSVRLQLPSPVHLSPGEDVQQTTEMQGLQWHSANRPM